METKDNISIAKAIYECFNKRDFKSTANLVDQNSELQIILFNQTFKGPKGMTQLLENWFIAFPDGKCEIKNVFGSGEYVSVELIGTGIQSGIFITPDGEQLTTNRKVSVPFNDRIRIRNGKIINSRSYFDLSTMMKQLGIVAETKYM